MPPLADCRQLLCVIADEWSSTTGSLQRHARENAAAAWQPVGAPWPVCLGRQGLAWGRGLHAAVDGPEMAKTEGDGKAPAGIFAISALFGYAAAGTPEAPLGSLPYWPATAALKCIDDPASTHYNCLVDSSLQASDWQSCEDMLRHDQRYALGAVIEHNPPPVQAGAGSCIFLHIHQAPEVPTAGCTALAAADMRRLADWLQATAHPCLVQLPRAVYRAYQTSWQLPPLLD